MVTDNSKSARTNLVFSNLCEGSEQLGATDNPFPEQQVMKIY